MILLALPGGAALAAFAGKTLLGGLIFFVVAILPVLFVFDRVRVAYRNFKTRKIRRDPRYRLGGYHYDEASHRWLRWDGERYRPDTDTPPWGFWPNPDNY
jgi:hypothetical protein